MAGNTFGQLFRITTFGESHGEAIGVVIDGCPAGLELDLNFIQSELDKRKPGQSKITTQRKESDTFKILSGVFENKTLGTPISIIIPNEDAKSNDYNYLKDTYRPSHADYTYEKKYGIRDHRGGGRSSARETVARVAAGAIAKLLLLQEKIQITAFVKQVGTIKTEKHYSELDLSEIDKNIVRSADPFIAGEMIKLIEHSRKNGDSVGGIIQCIVKNVPPGLGEPVFDKLHADLGKAMLSINAVHGFEYGSGFEGSSKKGSENNDEFTVTENRVRTKTNNSGGILGGISNGEDIYFNVAFKPTATIMHEQESINTKEEKVIIKNEGRHDPCVLPRAVPIVEAMTALVLADHLLRQKAISY
jgi:chorismate synthase